MKIKIKTHKSSKKRFFLNKLNLIKHKSSNTRHGLTKKSKKRKRHAKKLSIISKNNVSRLYKLIPYK